MVVSAGIIVVNVYWIEVELQLLVNLSDAKVSLDGMVVNHIPFIFTESKATYFFAKVFVVHRIHTAFEDGMESNLDD